MELLRKSTRPSGEADLGVLPSTDTFDVRFYLSGHDGSLVDLRAGNSTEEIFEFDIQPGAGGFPVRIRWRDSLNGVDEFPSIGSLRLQDAATGGSTINVDMREQTSILLADDSMTRLQVLFQGLHEFTFNDLPPKWNLLSVPLELDDMALTSIFPDAVSAFRFAAGYKALTELNPCEGFWVNLAIGGTYTIEGQEVEQCLNHLESGWSIVGTPFKGTGMDQVDQTPVNILLSTFLFDKGYLLATGFAPGLGYWVNLSQAGTAYIH